MLSFIKRLFKRYEMPSKAKLIGNMFYQGERGWHGNW